MTKTEYNKAYNSAHKEEIAARKRRYREANLQLLRDKAKAFADEHRSYYRQKSLEYRQNNPEYFKIMDRKHNSSVRGKFANKVHKYRRRAQIADSGSFTIVEWTARLEELGAKCYYCSNGYNTKDHLVPLIRGGSNRIENIVPACLSCNTRKGSKTLEEFLAWRVNAYTEAESRRTRKSPTGSILSL
jgi:5-methylcytosine-specific restriction endonuclease McrA